MTMIRKILVADDDPWLRRLVRFTLGNDYRLLEAADGEETLDVAHREMPDLILLDIRMPKLDGFEVCRRLKANETTAKTKVVILTGLASDEDRVAGGKAGADAYVVKPFSPRALLAKLAELLD